MSGHGHGHGHGHGCGCEGEHEPAERGLEYGLYRRIDLEKVQCLNESRDGDGKLVFKPWDQRNERDKVTAEHSLCPGQLSCLCPGGGTNGGGLGVNQQTEVTRVLLCEGVCALSVVLRSH